MHAWVDRAAAFDAWVDRETVQARVDAIRETHRRYAELGKAIFGKAVQALNALPAERLTPDEILRFALVSMWLQQAAYEFELSVLTSRVPAGQGHTAGAGSAEPAHPMPGPEFFEKVVRILGRKGLTDECDRALRDPVPAGSRGEAMRLVV